MSDRLAFTVKIAIKFKILFVKAIIENIRKVINLKLMGNKYNCFLFKKCVDATMKYVFPYMDINS